MPRIVEDKGKQTKLSNFFSARNKHDESEIKIINSDVEITAIKPLNPFKLRKSVSLTN